MPPRRLWLVLSSERATAAIAITALGISAYEALIKDDTPKRPARLVVEAKVRNLAMADRGPADRRSAKAGDVLLYETTVANIGDLPTSEVSLREEIPPAASGRYVSSSCRLVRDGSRREEKCIDADFDDGIALGALRPGAGVTVRHRFKVRLPVCSDGSFQSLAIANSKESEEVSDEIHVRAKTGSVVLPSCGSPGAELRTHIPSAFRDSCRNASFALGRPLAEVMCSPDKGVVKALHYAIYASAADTRDAYNARRRGADPFYRRGCPSRDDASESRYTTKEDQLVGRRLCWISEGEAAIEWSNPTRKIYAFALRADDDLAALYGWWADSAGPYR